EGPMPMVVRKVSQIVGLLLLVSTLFLILSVSLYTPEAPNANHYVSNGSTMVQQHGGVVRKALADWADWALQGLGSVVVLLTGIAVIDACCLLRGRIGTAVAVAARGLLCLVAVSACADLTFTSIRIGGTPFLAGGLSGKWLAETVVAALSSGIVGFAGRIRSRLLADGPSEPLWSPDPASTCADACGPESQADSLAPSASQRAVPPAGPSATTVRKRQLVVPILPTVPAAMSPIISEAKSLADSQSLS